MRLISRLHDRCFCAFCKSPRKVYSKKHVDLTNVLGALLFALTASAAYFGTLDPRAIVVACVLMVGSEIFVYLRWRQSLVCRLCGFDPIIYKRSPTEAAKRVRAFYEEQKDNPSFHLSRSPLLELQRQQVERKRIEAEMNWLDAKMLAKRPKANPLTKSKSL